ncbi:class I SAM-dependent DNA methyltransferase [Trueperella pyogenes]|uniref:class I SAM-dependent DNA methyltransferase n=1 Tax=Trueperella pyogenes TaxID=1661 RepID=UPI0030B9748F
MHRHRLCDPACGSGNFLIIAYKELRRLELAILERLEEISPKHRNRVVDSVIHIENFYGIEIDDFAAEVAVLSLWIAKHQMNIEFERKFVLALPLIPLKEAGRIVAGNAARLDWSEVCPNNGREEIYLIGNPPYGGSSMQDADQKEDLRLAFSERKFSANLDYVSIWFLKGADYIRGSRSALAFVSTNSISQGDHVGLLFPSLLTEGVEIGFAYTSFKWTNNARKNAGVTVVVVGLRNKSPRAKYLFRDNLQAKAKEINPYLVDGPTVYVLRRSVPLVSELSRMVFGSKATDGGGLIMTSDERDSLIRFEPNAERYIKSFIGARDYIEGNWRYCLWVTDDEYEAAQQLDPLRHRFEFVRKARTSPRSSSIARKFSEQPYRFVQRAYKPTDAIIVPGHSSERRDYVPVGFVGPETVISNAAFAIYDVGPWLFAILTSRMHMAWLRAVGGKIKEDFRYSNTIVYNNFPVPDGALTDRVKEELTQAALRILDVREYHSESTLAELYDRDTMPQNLREAHARVDELVDRLYSAKPYLTDEERLSDLFALYEKMSSEADAKVRKAKGKKE